MKLDSKHARLTNSNSMIKGMFYRTARMLEAGIKPVFVFDGKPPEIKRQQLDQRLERRTDADESLRKAQESGNQEEIEKYSKRSIRVTKQHNEECKELLRLLGVPIVDAATEAEAQCSSMCKSNTQPINEFDRAKALAGLGLDDAMFVDFCILCGCDYAGTIRGIGPIRALQLIQKHKTIENVLATLDPAKYPIPDDFEGAYQLARKFFHTPEVVPPEELPPLKWSDVDEDKLVAFLVGEKNFSEDRVRKTVQRIKAAKGKASQGRIESFFKPAPNQPPKPAAKPGEASGSKRKPEPPKKGPAAKKGKLGGVGGGKKK
ncbi:PIN domain-like protein [Dunaliella salina]|uniref:PIN domain-like protein n=1 Tax=Dunaliella salina TaxID=3046 RepID=A0ABQ7H5D0_DUNSA|nr:PIN domain-like protein [Dunaliella salina]|eukprot:KAF5842041.1 PIN domain-like protein [Dunaliella salina]